MEILQLRFREGVTAHQAGELERLDWQCRQGSSGMAYRLMAYKDEYELHRPGLSPHPWRAVFGNEAVSVWLAPPVLSRIDPPTGRPAKRRFGHWVFTAFAVLARLNSPRYSRFYGPVKEAAMAEYAAHAQEFWPVMPMRVFPQSTEQWPDGSAESCPRSATAEAKSGIAGSPKIRRTPHSRNCWCMPSL